MCEQQITMSYMPMEGGSRAVNHREGSLGRVVAGDGGRRGRLGGGRPLAPPAQHSAGGAVAPPLRRGGGGVEGRGGGGGGC